MANPACAAALFSFGRGALIKCLLLVVLVTSHLGSQAEEIKLFAAGSLSETFEAIIADYNASLSGRLDPLRVTPVWGPSGVLRQRLEQGTEFDLFAAAALPHAQALTTAGLAGPSMIFARNTLCAITGKEQPITSGNLVETLLKPEIRLGTSTPRADPAGDYTWQLFHLIDEYQAGAFEKLSGKARQLFGSATTTAPINGRHRITTSLENNEVDVFIYYCSGIQQVLAQSTAFKKIDLPAAFAVGAEYGLTASRRASPATASLAFYILSPRGQRILQAHGFVPVALPLGPEAQ